MIIQNATILTKTTIINQNETILIIFNHKPEQTCKTLSLFIEETKKTETKQVHFVQVGGGKKMASDILFERK